MKKWFRPLLILALLVAALTVSASAADPDAAGMYNVQTAAGTTITPRNTVGTVTADNSNANYPNFYKEAVKFDVTCSGLTAGNQYLLLVLSDNKAPGADNIVYINQDVADADGKVTFSDTDVAYPSSLVKGNEYHVYVVGADKTFTADTGAVATFQNIQPYTPGDVNQDTKINVNDAMAIINHIVSREVLTGVSWQAAEVTGDGSVNVNDAMEIINYIVGRPQYLV